MRSWIPAGLLLLAASSAAQSLPCPDDSLQRAARSYQAGRFEEVPVIVAPCLEGRLPRARVIEFRTLLAKAYLEADDLVAARKEVSAILRLDPNFDAGSPPRLVALVAAVKREEQTTQVASVSKTSESLREAPATVVVVTGEEIARRGYLDLEQLLHDLPGFDISRLNGDIYSNIYQRGYRSANDRLLFLVDGVEQNELSSGIVYLSRQYPLTNIDRVEVIYGPASTMYGANAYTGVISILTKEPESLTGEGKPFGMASQITQGGYGSRSGDVTVAGKDGSGTIAWSLAANFQQSRERDLSALRDWDYSYQGFDYASKLRLTGVLAEGFFKNCSQPSPYFQCTGQIPFQRTINLTGAGVEFVRGLDRALIAGQGLGFDDRATNWSVDGKLRISNLTVGLQMWQSQEGIASEYGALATSGRTTWTPRQSALYVKYSVPLEKVKVNFFTRYEQSNIERGGSQFEYLHTYARGLLGLKSLVPPCKGDADNAPIGCPAMPWVETVSFASLSSQLRSELNASYDSSEKIKAVAGLELAKSSIQSQLAQTPSGPGQLHYSVSHPEQIEHTDLAVYAQGSWKPRPSLKFILAGRLTDNQINNKAGAAGFGTLFTPRAGVIYMPAGHRVTLKAIYSEAFKDPTDAQKFGVVPEVNEYPSKGLKPETVRNMELSAGWEPTDRSSFEASGYQARYADVVSFGGVTGCNGTGCKRYENRDAIRIRGLQGTARYRGDWGELWGNYTHTEPFLIDPRDAFGSPLLDAQRQAVARLRVADIAANRVSAGFDSRRPEWLKIGLRLHYVGARRSGAGTTEPGNPFARMDAYTTADAIVSESRLPRNVTLQLIVYNLFDKQYYDPAINTGAGGVGIPRVLQPGRTIYVRLTYALRRAE